LSSAQKSTEKQRRVKHIDEICVRCLALPEATAAIDVAAGAAWFEWGAWFRYCYLTSAAIVGR
jgi:hypothetical protein